MKRYESITQLYFRSIREFRELESVPRDFGTGDLLYSSEVHTLEAIGKNRGINLTELSEKLDISKSGTSKFVKKLLSKGLVTKNQNPGNRKEFYYDLTEKGKLAFAGHKKFSAETFNRITGLLNKMTEEESLFLEKFLTDLVLEVEELNKRY